MQRYQTKSCRLEFKVDQSQRIIEGYFSAFGVKDADGEIVPQGAYLKTISERGPASGKPRISYLYNHDPSLMPLGLLLHLEEDSKGLAYAAKVAKTPMGDAALELAGMGALTEHSIGYQVVKDHYDKGLGGRVLDEIKLWEGSLVVWGANEFTPVTGVKSLRLTPDLSSKIERLAASCKEEDLKLQLELLAQQLKAEQEEALDEKEQPADEATEPVIEPQTDAELKALISELNLIKDAFGRQ